MAARNSFRQSFTLKKPGLSSNDNRTWLQEQLLYVLRTIEGSNIDDSEPRVVVTITANTWSRAARRKRRLLPDMGLDEMPATRHDSMQEVVQTRIILQWDPALNRQLDSLPITTAPRRLQIVAELCCDWAYGQDRTLFESFWSHVVRKLGDFINSGIS